MSYSLREFGSYTAGGRVHRVGEGRPRRIRVTRDTAIDHDPRGHFAVEHAYVQFFVPEAARDLPPVVLVHGGGLHGGCWETTPDGRPGWLHLLLDAGREVHVADMAERGRAGFAPGLWEGAPILRSMEDAWTLFRFGRAEDFLARRPFPGQQFPVEALDAFARGFAPRWLSTAALQRAALEAVLDRLPTPLVICHSQGAEPVFDAAAARPGRVSAIAAVEPSALPDAPPPAPLAMIEGDFLGIDPGWRTRAARWRDYASVHGAALVASARDVAPGGSHMLMMDRHGPACLEALMAALPG